ncbi:unnamed protein product [Didymodactylos carnosus]|uniref:Uncharacterized protein n=1 Tax=Didymodactylos carnosus TaxID=1234261 RepID=A0A814PWS5_9BILA|nr:unnamed protein product [Didymodactylos carnosus]CAF3875791.1 unnamed protein product [Didymodactylos carnosus]
MWQAYFFSGPLKDIINELSREMSILQITQGNMGVITLNKMDCQWIEQLSRASLENEKDYFIKLNTPLNFNFLYVQSYLIRTYLLYCRINYEHIKGKYQCYTQRKPPITTINLVVNDVEQLASKTQNTRFAITFKDGKQTKYHCSKPEKFYMQLKKIFDEKKYDLNTIDIIDPNQILVDFMKTNVNNSLPIIEEEYHIKEKRLLIRIILEFENNQLKYFATSEATITSILSHFILDQQLKFTPLETYFSVFDSLGRYIAEDCQINNIYQSDEQTSIQIRVCRCKQDANICCEVTLTAGQEQQHIIDEDQTISLALDQAESISVDLFNGEDVIDIILSYDNNSQTIRILKSCPVRIIKQLLEMIKINDDHIYLASYETKMILSENIKLSTINETKFFLVKEHQTCLISIEQSDDALVAVTEDNMQNQRYLINAAMNDIYKQNKNIDQDRLTLSDDSIIDEEDSLNDTGESINDLQLKLVSTADAKCALTYQDETITISVTNEILLSSIMKEALEKLLIPLDDIDMYELKVLDDPDSPTTVDLDSSIDEIRSDFHIESATPPFLLEKKENEN